METLMNLDYSNNPTFIIVTLCLAVGRIWLEIIGFNFQKLPMTAKLSAANGEDRLRKFHRMGLYFSVGYILFFAPGILMS